MVQKCIQITTEGEKEKTEGLESNEGEIKLHLLLETRSNSTLKNAETIIKLIT